ncbi:MAG: caspase family protein [Blastocatellia bacterium]
MNKRLRGSLCLLISLSLVGAPSAAGFAQPATEDPKKVAKAPPPPPPTIWQLIVDQFKWLGGRNEGRTQTMNRGPETDKAIAPTNFAKVFSDDVTLKWEAKWEWATIELSCRGVDGRQCRFSQKDSIKFTIENIRKEKAREKRILLRDIQPVEPKENKNLVWTWAVLGKNGQQLQAPGHFVQVPEISSEWFDRHFERHFERLSTEERNQLISEAFPQCEYRRIAEADVINPKDFIRQLRNRLRSTNNPYHLGAELDEKISGMDADVEGTPKFWADIVNQFNTSPIATQSSPTGAVSDCPSVTALSWDEREKIEKAFPGSLRKGRLFVLEAKQKDLLKVLWYVSIGYPYEALRLLENSFSRECQEYAPLNELAYRLSCAESSYLDPALDSTNLVALLIGVSGYDERGLDFPAKEAVAMRDLLREKVGHGAEIKLLVSPTENQKLEFEKYREAGAKLPPAKRFDVGDAMENWLPTRLSAWLSPGDVRDPDNFLLMLQNANLPLGVYPLIAYLQDTISQANPATPASGQAEQLRPILRGIIENSKFGGKVGLLNTFAEYLIEYPKDAPECIDPKAFLEDLRKDNRDVATTLRARLSHNDQNALGRYDEIDRAARARLLTAVVQMLNKLVTTGQSLDKILPGIGSEAYLTRATLADLEKGWQGEQLLELNRRILSELYPGRLSGLAYASDAPFCLDSAGLAARIQQAGTLLTAYLREQLSPITREKLERWQSGSAETFMLLAEVVDELNSKVVSSGVDLWQKLQGLKELAGDPLLSNNEQEKFWKTYINRDSPLTATLRAEFRKTGDFKRLNRWLLEEAYPSYVVERPPTQNTTLLIYFSGHGEKIKNQTYLLPQDYRTEGNYVHNGISLTQLYELLTGYMPYVKQAVIIIDACDSGEIAKKFEASMSEGEMPWLTDTVVLCAAENKAKEKSNGGIFTTALLEALKGKDRLTALQLFQKIQLQVSGQQEPKHWETSRSLLVVGKGR